MGQRCRGEKDLKQMEKREIIKSHGELEVYQISFDAAMRIFVITKEFPHEEKYSLTDQICRSSRSVCSNIAEDWRKRRYMDLKQLIIFFRNSETLTEMNKNKIFT